MTMGVLIRSRAVAIAFGLCAAAGFAGTANAQDEDLATMMAAGKIVFSDNCAVCHGEGGEGTNNAPSLNGNGFVESRGGVINQVIAGNMDHGMPPFGDVLSDEEIASVATYVRNSWSNNYGIVFTRSVELRRGK